MIQICIFEDNKVEQLYPLTLSRPVYELRFGIKTLRKKLMDLYPKAEFSFHCRSYLKDTLSEKTSLPINSLKITNSKIQSILFINGRAIGDAKLARELPLKGKSQFLTKGNTVIAALVNKSDLKKMKLPELFQKKHFPGKEVKVDVTTIDYYWDLIRLNADMITKDAHDTLLLGKHHTTPSSNVILLEKQNIFIGKNVTIKPGTILDASGGPIFIDNNVTIFPNVTIMGPVYLGFKTTVKAGTKIYGGTTIGPICKVAGELENTIMQGYSNKAHDGFLGSSFIGSWVNLGAGTENSNLKNNYSTVKVTINDKLINTASSFVGSAIGDHSKTGIKTMLNTGTVIGFSANIYGSGFQSKVIPSFCWGEPNAYTTYEMEKAINTARAVMQRRNVTFSPKQKKLFEKIFTLTKQNRKFSKKKSK
jgi:UDP-N-acetylglucosamine diphosphorylase/glucosamine-1-phosphate N-acetyltransferase